VGLGWHCSSNITSLIPTPTIFKGNNRSNFGNPHLYVLGCKSSDILEFSHLKFLQGICTNWFSALPFLSFYVWLM
jgi:hypothetical protein